VAGSGKKKNHDEIMDGIILQLNKTKKMFIIMILTLIILPPLSFVITFALLGRFLELLAEVGLLTSFLLWI
jgi:hypothetical protein